MKNSKKIITGVGIANLLTFILMVVIPYVRQYRYLVITNGIHALIYLIFAFTPFYSTFLVLKLKKKKDISLKPNWKSFPLIVLFCLILFLHLIIINLFFNLVLESQTTNIDNYLILDRGFKNNELLIFPKSISKNAQNIKYNYRYITLDEEDDWYSDYDLYLEMELPEEEYILEKERIKSFTDFKKAEHKIYLNSSEEYIKYCIKHWSDDSIMYYFAAFFDEQNKIVYNYSFGYIKPYFIRINEDNIKCE